MAQHVPDHLTKLSAQQKEYVHWLTTPPELREIKTKRDFAKHLGVTPDTLNRWEKYPSVRRLREAVFASMNISPERVQTLVEQMYADATDMAAKPADRLAARKQYLAYIGRLESTSLEEKADALTLDEATDEELELMEQAMKQVKDELAERRRAG